MANLNIALYALNSLGPQKIASELQNMKQDGFTTIILSMLHIGNPAVKAGTQLGDIIFNGDEPIIIRDGRYFPDAPDWPADIAEIKGPGSTVTQIYASCGGAAGPVKDFETLKYIYENNNNSFAGTQLEKNFQAFHTTFPAVDGIDMDCEETYDVASFVAFCKMLIRIGFRITFCPYERPYQRPDFWTDALVQVENEFPQAVQWWNLQCYAGGNGNNPEDWAAAIIKASPGHQTDN